nr:MAG TPA: hypothetical protein [Caudoviricetes sp.]
MKSSLQSHPRQKRSNLSFISTRSTGTSKR